MYSYFYLILFERFKLNTKIGDCVFLKISQYSSLNLEKKEKKRNLFLIFDKLKNPKSTTHTHTHTHSPKSLNCIISRHLRINHRRNLIFRLAHVNFDLKHNKNKASQNEPEMLGVSIKKTQKEAL
jgi:hypothetical protein